MKTSYHAHGKLLLSGEYVVLDGAKALAIPTQKGQLLEVIEHQKDCIEWVSHQADGTLWFKHSFSIKDLNSSSHNEPTVEGRLEAIFAVLVSLKPNLFDNGGYSFVSRLAFDKQWGLGSSSTLIANLANWSGVNPYELLKLTFGGSGYDIAAAVNDSPIVYQSIDTGPKITPVSFTPPFKDQLFFVYLNRKQNSRKSIALYRNAPKSQLNQAIEAISQITEALIECTTLIQFETLLLHHEQIISKLIQLEPVQSLLFSEYKAGIVKSLGGWGGDFVLVTGTIETVSFFKDKGYTTIVPYRDMFF